MQDARTGELLGNSFRLAVAAALVACGLGVAAALLMLGAGAFIDGLLVGAVTVFTFRGFWRLSRRKRELMKRGWFAGRRVGTHWAYEELRARQIVSIELPLDYVGSGEYEIHVPGERAWRAGMPEWARERRAEILERLQTVFKLSQLRFDPDTPADAP